MAVAELHENQEGYECDECGAEAKFWDEETASYFCPDHVPEVAGGRTNNQHDFVR